MTKLPFAGATALITIKKNCCPYPSMSSCAASSCMSFPKALSAFATLASSPTGAAPLSCRFALNYSEQYSHRRPNQKLSLLRNRARAHLALSQVWRKDGDHRATYRGPTPTPLSTLSRRSSRMKLQLQPSSLGASRHLPVWCALLTPNHLSLSNLGSNCRSSPMPTTKKTILRSLFSCSSTCSRSFSHHSNTIQFA